MRDVYPQANKKELNYLGLETDRLLMRMFDENDLESAYEMFNDSDVQKYLSPKNRRTREHLKFTFKKIIERWSEKGFGIWCVSKKQNGEMIGYCGFQQLEQTENVEVVFGFLKKHWGNGFATEALEASLNFGFEKLSLKKFYAVTNPENIGSVRVLEKSGMTFMKKESHYDMETCIYSISKIQWFAK